MRGARGSFAVAALAAACSSPAPPPPPVCPSFEKITLDSVYRSEGASVFDVDRDGHADIVTNEFWYAGPDFTPHAISDPNVFDPTQPTYADGFAVYPTDIDGDGWTDIIVDPHPGDAMFWFENPHGLRATLWPKHMIAPQGVAGVESPIFEDLFGDGHPVLIMGDSTPTALVLGWWEPRADPTLPWTLHPISAPSFPGAATFAHGLGVGDVNGDGKLDVLTSFGWFEQTSDRATWKEHDFAFGPFPPAACSKMSAFDYDGDGLNDVICARPHDFGIHWWQQRAGGTFVDHVIDDTLSEMHSVELHDFDGDGVPEIVTGKRWLSYSDGSAPGASDPALLVCYGAKRGPVAGATFTRADIDDDSGVGGGFAIADVDGDGKDDIVTSNKKGLFFFRQR